MPRVESSILPQARLLRILVHAWIVTASLSGLALVVSAVFIGSNVLGLERSLPSNLAINPTSTAEPESQSLAGNTGSSVSPGGQANSAMAPASDTSSAPPNAGTRVLSGTSGNASGAAARAAVEAKLGQWLTLEKCEPDAPIYALVRGRWHEANVLFVRGNSVMVRFVDPSFSDEECALSQLRQRTPDAAPVQQVAAGSMTQKPLTQDPGKSAPEYHAGDWVEFYSPESQAWQLAAVVEIFPNADIIIRLAAQNVPDMTVKSVQLRPWDHKSAPAYASRNHPPGKACVNPRAQDFIPGEEVFLAGRSRFSSGRVIRAQEEKVLLRWNDPYKADELISPRALRLAVWGPYQERVIPTSADVPAYVEKVGSPRPLNDFKPGESVDIVFRGQWASGTVASVADGTVLVDAKRTGTRVRAVLGEIRPGTVGLVESAVAPRNFSGPQTISPPPNHYKAGDLVETLSSADTWLPARVAKVEPDRVVVDSVEGQIARTQTQVRMSRELAMARARELMGVKLSDGAAAASFDSSNPGSGAVAPEPESARTLLISDIKPGMLVGVNKSRRQDQRIIVAARVTRVEGAQVFARPLEGSSEGSWDVADVITYKSDNYKSAAQYKPGERVYVNFSTQGASTWGPNRIERVDGYKIILRESGQGRADVESRSVTVDNVRPVKMADELVTLPR